jgi:hypothetical protein
MSIPRPDRDKRPVWSAGGRTWPHRELALIPHLFTPAFQFAANIPRLQPQCRADIDKRKGPTRLVRKNPFFGFPGQALGSSTALQTLLLQTCDGVLEDRPHQREFSAVQPLDRIPELFGQNCA